MYVANETVREIVVSRTKIYRIPANSLVSVDALANALGTDYNDIRMSLEAQYPDLKLIDASIVVGSHGLPGDEHEVDELCGTRAGTC